MVGEAYCRMALPIRHNRSERSSLLTSSVRKGVILAAGYGTRFLPATKAAPKELFPLVDKPLIQYVVEEAVASGLVQVIVVTTASKRALEDHFDRQPDLERVLEAKGDEGCLREVRRLADLADIAFVRQKERRGIGHAVLAAQPFVGDEPFALFFPDDIVFADVPAIDQLIQVHERYGGSVLAAQRVPREDVVHYGIIQARPVDDRLYEVLGIVEKPRVEEAPSDLAAFGRYILEPEVFAVLAETPSGREGQLELTDGLALLVERGHRLYAYECEGERHDTGRPLGLLKASLAEALRRPDIGPELRDYLQSLDLG
ncbi:MAG: UTP--glucose-1-phosphate uridylyltransferase [Dehalococcoidia bacterium]